MKKTLTKKLLSLVCALCIVCAFGAASAESLSLTGTVEAGKTITVYAPVGGTAESVNAEAGMTVKAGDELAVIGTTKVYAPEDGTITGLFAREGDDGDRVTEVYGAAMYLEGDVKYTVSGDVSKAYSAVETTLVHSGEKVYLQCRANAARSGEGTITASDGTKYTVLVTSGDFIPGDSVDIYRDEAHTNELRIGRGSVSRQNPTAVTASGAIVRIAVKDGDEVKKGDLLLETAEGSFDGYKAESTVVTAPEDSIVASVSAEEGSAVSQHQAIVTLYPLSAMRVEVLVPADNRKDLKEGDPVQIELEADEGKTYTGTVVRISALPEEGAEEVSYRVYIDFTPDEAVALGMNVIVTTEDAGAQAEQAAEEEEQEEEAEAEAEAEEEAETKPAGRPEFPEGTRPELPEGAQPGELPEGVTPDQLPEGAQPETPAD